MQQYDEQESIRPGVSASNSAVAPRPHPLYPYLMKVFFALLSLSTLALAKDKDITLEECPAPVKATIAEYSKKFAFEKVELEGKSEPKVYGAKFLSPDGRRFEIIMSDDGKVQKTELKKSKTEEKQPEKEKGKGKDKAK